MRKPWIKKKSCLIIYIVLSTDLQMSIYQQLYYSLSKKELWLLFSLLCTGKDAQITTNCKMQQNSVNVSPYSSSAIKMFSRRCRRVLKTMFFIILFKILKVSIKHLGNYRVNNTMFFFLNESIYVHKTDY